MWLRKSRKEPVLSHISMKNLPESERPYERFQILGAEALSDAELLAIILKTGTKDYTALDLARSRGLLLPDSHRVFQKRDHRVRREAPKSDIR